MATESYRLDLTLAVEGDLAFGTTLFHTQVAQLTAERTEGTYVELERGEVFNFDPTITELLDLSGSQPGDDPLPPPSAKSTPANSPELTNLLCSSP